MKRFFLIITYLFLGLLIKGSAQDTTTICQGDSLLLSTPAITGVTAVEWYRNGFLVSSDPLFIITEPGTYTLRCENSSGCISGFSDPLVVIRSTITAYNDTTYTRPGTPIDIGILINDESPCFPMDTISLAVVTTPANGSVSIDDSGRFVYLPEDGFLGIDTFTYIIYDVNGNPSNTAMVVILVTDGGPLPIALSRFEAIKQGEEALLVWTTQHTENASHFEIERSGNAKDFVHIGDVAATANSTYAIDYRYIDAAPLSGRNYYRLKLVDINGIFKYSEIRMLDFDIKSRIKIYPNPASSYVNISMGKDAGNISEIAVVDMHGRILKRQNVMQETETLNIQDLAVANYYIRLIGKDNDIKATLKFSKTD